MKNEKVLMYRDNGEIFLGEYSIQQKLSYYKWVGKQKNQKYMYKGYYYKLYEEEGNNKYIVIVYTNTKWNSGEIAKRKANGFKGIREYKI